MRYNEHMKRHIASIKKETVPHYFIIIGSIALAAMILAAFVAVRQSVWFDEAYSIMVAKQPVGEVIRLAGVDTHPPLYYLVLKVWAGTFGWGEMALRSLSILAYGGSIAIGALLVRRMYGERASLGAAACMLFAPLMMRYGFEIRMYAVASLIGILATYVLVRTEQTGRNRDWALYGILVALGMYTLYYTAFLWTAHLVWLLIVQRKRLRAVHQSKWLWSYLGAAVLFLPWLPTFLKQMNNGALASIGQPMNLEQMLGIVSFNTLYKPLWQLTVIDTILVLIVLVIGIGSVIRAYRDAANRDYLLLLLCYILVPIVLLMGISFFKPMYVERYLSHVAIGFILLLAVSVWSASRQRSRRYRYGIMAVLVGMVAVGYAQLAAVGNFNFQRMQHPENNQVKSLLANCPTESVLAADPYVAIELAYYVPVGCDVKFYTEWRSMGGGYAPLSESANIVANPVPMLQPLIHYVYYDTQKLTLDPSYHEVAVTDYDTLHIATYKKEQ